MMLLGLYSALTAAGGPLIEALLRRRARAGKEDPKRLGERLGHPGLARPDAPLVWLHGASVGEAVATLPLIEALLERRLELQVLLTTGTLTSARLVEGRLPARARHQFAPVDRAEAWRRFLAYWRPRLAVLVESELWPNLIREVSRQGIPIALVNARMSGSSYARWRWLPWVARALLGRIDLCLAQSGADAGRFRALGAPAVRVSGNLKQAAAPLAADPEALASLRTTLGERPRWLAASTHPGEDEQVLDVHRALLEQRPALALILVPRHPDRGATLAALARARSFRTARRAEGEAPDRATEVYVADTLGELGLFYRLAPMALIGGSLVPHGGQNPLEAARLGCVPIFGPHTQNFTEITGMLERQDAALRVADRAALLETVTWLLDHPTELRERASRALSAAESERSVLGVTLDALDRLLDHRRPTDHAAT